MGKFGPEIEVHDSFRALEKLGQYHGLWDRKDDSSTEWQEVLTEAITKAHERKALRDDGQLTD